MNTTLGLSGGSQHVATQALAGAFRQVSHTDRGGAYLGEGAVTPQSLQCDRPNCLWCEIKQASRRPERRGLSVLTSPSGRLEQVGKPEPAGSVVGFTQQPEFLALPGADLTLRDTPALAQQTPPSIGLPIQAQPRPMSLSKLASPGALRRDLDLQKKVAALRESNMTVEGIALQLSVPVDRVRALSAALSGRHRAPDQHQEYGRAEPIPATVHTPFFSETPDNSIFQRIRSI